MVIYQVIHWYDVDGGYGDAVGLNNTLASFVNLEDAKSFVEKYSDKHCYDVPYDELWCGKLTILEVHIKDHFNPDDYDTYPMWWLHNDHIEVDTEEDEDNEIEVITTT